MKEGIISLLKSMRYKGKYLLRIKQNFDWELILKQTEIYKEFSDKERLYLFLNPEINPFCGNERPKKFISIYLGYKDICCDYLQCDICKELVLNKTKTVWKEKYGVDNISKSVEIKKKKEETSIRNWGVCQPLSSNIVKEKSKKTKFEKYGNENYSNREKSKETCLSKYSVDNPSKLETVKQKKTETSLKNYGVDNPNKSEIVQNKRKVTNILKYGFDVATKNETVKNKIMQTKIKNGSFSISNSSTEATLYFRNYCDINGYDKNQVAFSDFENGLFEFGYNFGGKWYLYDFVAFEEGFRGNVDKIIEIIEYHGPFHYTQQDVIERGEKNAYPWGSKNITIKESFENDQTKEYLAKKFLTKNYKIIWAEKYHKLNEE